MVILVNILGILELNLLFDFFIESSLVLILFFSKEIRLFKSFSSLQYISLEVFKFLIEVFEIMLYRKMKSILELIKILFISINCNFSLSSKLSLEILFLNF